MVLFSEHGSSLVHHYRVLGWSAAHASLRGFSTADLSIVGVRRCPSSASTFQLKAGFLKNGMITFLMFGMEVPLEDTHVLYEYGFVCIVLRSF